MDLKLLNTQGITKFGSTELECSCGRIHKPLTKNIIFEGSAVVKSGLLAAAVPPPSLIGVMVSSHDRSFMGRNIEKQLARDGYKTVTHVTESSGLIKSSDAHEINFPENVRLIIYAGDSSASALAKYKAEELKIPYALFCLTCDLTTALAPSSLLFEDGTEQVFKTSAPTAVAVDTRLLLKTTTENAAAGFGALCSKLISLFDYRLAALLNGEQFCPVIFEQGVSEIDACVQKVEQILASGGLGGRAVIAEHSLKYSALCQLCGNSRLFSGAEAQAAHALSILYNFEEREIKQRGENEMLFARLLIRLYKSMLEKNENFFVPPPDNNLRLEKITEFLGLEENRVINKIRPIASAAEVKLSAYKLCEYRHELYAILCSFDSRLSRGWRIFKRLYEDDGYSLVNYLDSTAVSVSLALAPDLKDKFTFLTYMKNAGYLDLYLKDVV